MYSCINDHVPPVVEAVIEQQVGCSGARHFQVLAGDPVQVRLRDAQREHPSEDLLDALDGRYGAH